MNHKKISGIIISAVLLMSLVGCNKADKNIQQAENDKNIIETEGNTEKDNVTSEGSSVSENSNNDKENENKEDSNSTTNNDNNEIDATDDSSKTVEYNKYFNTRFYFSIEYPSDLVEQPAPTNNDGRIFSNEDNTVRLVASGHNNVMNETAQSGLEDELKSKSNVTYQNLSERSYVVSWEENGESLYTCAVFGEGSVNQFTIQYPTSQAEKYSKIVERVYDSFTPGDLSKGY